MALAADGTWTTLARGARPGPLFVDGGVTWLDLGAVTVVHPAVACNSCVDRIVPVAQTARIVTLAGGKERVLVDALDPPQAFTADRGALFWVDENATKIWTASW
jgi:hypothetical protein